MLKITAVNPDNLGGYSVGNACRVLEFLTPGQKSRTELEAEVAELKQQILSLGARSDQSIQALWGTHR